MVEVASSTQVQLFRLCIGYLMPHTNRMDPEEFRRYGKQLVDWIADYLQHAERYPVLSQVRPGDIKKQLPPGPPSQGQSMEQIFRDFESIVLPGITHWNHPSFFAYFSISGSPPGILAELLSAALNVNGMLWKTSPAATELEEVVLDWLRQMLGLPADFEGVITDTASVSSLLAIAAAREALHQRIREEGMSGRSDLPRLRLYCSEHAHSSIEKGAITVGIGQTGVRKIPVDQEFRLRPDLLRDAIREDRAAGYLPFCAVATVGTTSTTSIDPVPEIAEICASEGLWLHVDGAYGGVAAIVPNRQNILRGCDRADSIVVNPHKWLMTPIDCSAFYVRKPEILRQAFSLVPEYLRTSEEDVKNYMDYGVQLGRRFRALKLWFVIRSYGVEGLRNHITEGCRLAQKFSDWVDEHPAFERLAPVPFSVVCFRYRPPGHLDESALQRLNERLLEAVNATGEVFLSHTKLGDRYTLRLAVGNQATQERHVARAWELLTSEASGLSS